MTPVGGPRRPSAGVRLLQGCIAAGLAAGTARAVSAVGGPGLPHIPEETPGASGAAPTSRRSAGSIAQGSRPVGVARRGGALVDRRGPAQRLAGPLERSATGAPSARCGRPRDIPVGSPVETTGISSGYSAARWHPLYGGWKPHFGVDLPAPRGTPVRATADGVVQSVLRTGSYGLIVELRHEVPLGPGAARGTGPTRTGPALARAVVVTRYAHNEAVLVSPGQRVRRGDVVARVGSSGHATAPHVHYEIFAHGWSVDPRPSLAMRAEPACLHDQEQGERLAVATRGNPSSREPDGEAAHQARTGTAR